MQHPCSHDNAFCNIRLQTRISRRTWQHKNDNNHAAITLRSATRESRNAENYTHTHTREQSVVAEHRGGTDRASFDRSRTRRTQEVAFIAGRSHFTRKKHKVSCPGFLPKRSPCNIHAAITMRFATSGCKPASFDAHGNTKRQQSCSHYTAICNQRVKKRRELHTREQPLVAEHRGGTDRASFDRSRARSTQEVAFIAGWSHFTRKKHKVSCPGFLPKRSPCNIHAAITMRFATSGCKPAPFDSHGNTKRQQSCSHYTAICNQRVKKRRELCTREQPLVAEHRGGTDRASFDRSRTRRTQEVAFIAGPSHFTQTNTRFPAPAFSQNEAHATSMQPLQCVSQHQVANPHLSTHMATQNDNNHAATTLRSASRE